MQKFLVRAIVLGSLTIDHDSGNCNHGACWDTLQLGEHPQHARQANRPVAKLTVHSPLNFYTRLASSADVGFAESYMAGELSVQHPEVLVDIFKILILNRDNNTLSSNRLYLPKVGALLNTICHSFNVNTLTGSARNIHKHYDLSNDLFGTFLGDSWTYSCAYFDSQGSSLDAAQQAKLDMIIRKARIETDHYVLEIGCGWGEFAIRACKSTGCQVIGITLSREQLALARQRAMEAGVSDRVRFELMDYRELSKFGRVFDRVISIEMLEAVGHEFLPTFFSVVEEITKPCAVVVLQVITTPEERYARYLASVDFIQKHIFPGGICPSFEALVCSLSKGSRFSVEHAENIGPHYAVTLRQWRQRFLSNVGNGKVGLAGFDEIFVRKWTYYFCYCEAGFASRTLGNMQLVLSRPGNVLSLGSL